MRVIGGSARGRLFDAPPGTDTRPITDRAKEAIFNMVHSLGGLHGATVLDCYAGSGSFGIESLSRGADAAIFVERSRRAVAVLHKNLTKLGMADQATVIVAPVEHALRTMAAVDVAFLDPPYALDPWGELFQTVPATLVVGHADHEVVIPEEWEELRRRKYGRSRIFLARRDLKYPTAPDPG